MTTKLPFLSDEHHYAIANVAVRSSQLEWHIEQVVYVGLLRQQNTARHLLKNLGADRVIGLMEAILVDTLPSQRAAISELASEITRVRGERNDILHWIWGKTEKPDTAVHLTARPFRERKMKRKTAPDIQAIADAMLKLSHALVSWENQLHEIVCRP